MKNYKYYGDIKPHASVEEGEKIRPQCKLRRYMDGHGEHMVEVTHLPSGQSVKSSSGNELEALQLLAANV